MAFTYEFVPGRGSHYRGRVRSFVHRKDNRKPKIATTAENNDDGLPSASQPSILADPKNLLVSRIDPFNVLGTDFDQFENSMLNHYILHCIPNLGKRTSPDCFFPPRDIDWQNIRGNKVLMTTAVQFAAMSVALVESKGEHRFENANKYHLRALQLFRHQLEIEKRKPTDAALHAITGLLATDSHIRRWHKPPDGLESQLSYHTEGMRAALDCRDGWNLACYSPVLQWELIWQDIVVGGRISAGKTMFSPHIEKIDVAEALQSGSSFQQQWDRLCVSEFIAAYSDFYEAAHVRAQVPVDDGELYGPKVRGLFSPGTRAYETMSSNEHAVIGPIAPVLMVNIMIFDLQDAPMEEVAYQYWALRKKFLRCDVDHGSGPAYLVFAVGMTADMRAWAEPHQMCLLARMFGIASKLSKGSQGKLKHSLLGFITGATEGHDEGWWKPADLRDQMRVEGIIEF